MATDFEKLQLIVAALDTKIDAKLQVFATHGDFTDAVVKPTLGAFVLIEVDETKDDEMWLYHTIEAGDEIEWAPCVQLGGVSNSAVDTILEKLVIEKLGDMVGLDEPLTDIINRVITTRIGDMNPLVAKLQKEGYLPKD